ncbi:hypothetical protein ACLOAV_008566 [Pseudogymnoascus australis]
MARVSFRYMLVGVPFLCVYLTACYLNIHNHDLGARIRKAVEDHDLVEPLELPRHPLLKPNLTETDPPVVDNFPLAQAAASARELPPVPSWNAPPRPHVPEKTPLLIGFTRNWRILQQAVVAYITAGWPPEDIYVIENTGTMDANEHGKLSLQNPFFLNHTRLHMLGSTGLNTSGRIWTGVASFEEEEPFASLYMKAVYTLRGTTVPDYGRWAQVLFSYDRLALVNTAAYTEVGAWDTQIPYYLTDCDMHERLEHWPQYFWSHMDFIALRGTTVPDYGRWAQVLFSYDRLALVNTAAYTEVGAWDTQIPYYLTDCDMHERLGMAGYKVEEKKIGHISDVGTSVSDLLSLYRQQVGPEASFVDPNPPEAYDMDKKGPKTKRGKSADSTWPEYTGGTHHTKLSCALLMRWTIRSIAHPREGIFGSIARLEARGSHITAIRLALKQRFDDN